ncbi:MAG: nucleotidyltransferase family protein [Halobacteriota archaeon]
MTTDLPIVDPDDLSDGGGGPRRDASVGGVLLAAGTSTRFGEANKLLATVEDDPVVRRAAETLLAAGLDSLVVVVGHEADRVEQALEGLPVEIVVNPEYEAGQATSVRVGVDALDGVDAAVVGLGDMPFVDPASVRALVRAYRNGPWTALAVACDGVRGNPVLFDSCHFEALTTVAGDVGGRHILLDGDDSALVETHDTGVRTDIDTQTDLERVRDE